MIPYVRGRSDARIIRRIWWEVDTPEYLTHTSYRESLPPSPPGWRRYDDRSTILRAILTTIVDVAHDISRMTSYPEIDPVLRIADDDRIYRWWLSDIYDEVHIASIMIKKVTMSSRKYFLYPIICNIPSYVLEYISIPNFLLCSPLNSDTRSMGLSSHSHSYLSLYEYQQVLSMEYSVTTSATSSPTHQYDHVVLDIVL
jgi:hypothetical protein